MFIAATMRRCTPHGKLSSCATDSPCACCSEDDFVSARSKPIGWGFDWAQKFYKCTDTISN